MRKFYWTLLLLFLQIHLTKAQNGFNISTESLKNILSSSENKNNIEEQKILAVQLIDEKLVAEIDQKISLGNGWMLISVKDFLQQQIHVNYFIQQMGYITAESKRSTDFSNISSIQKSWDGGQRNPVSIYYYGVSEDFIKKLLGGKSIVKSSSEGRYVTVFINKYELDELLQYSFILFAAPVLEERTPLASTGITMSRVNKVHDAINGGLNLKGTNVKIGIWDYGTSGNHVDIEQNVNYVESEFYNTTGSQHTTQVSGAIAGKGILNPTIVGVAPESKLYLHNFYGDILSEMISAYQNGVKITNHSYNVGPTFTCFTYYQYDEASYAMDVLARNYPDLINVFAVGNSAVGCPYEYGNIVPGFQYGKNNITVGWLQNNETLYPGSAKGPTTDGRLKPDITLKGAGTFTPTATGLILTGINQNYVGSFGSSFASPQIAGIAGLMQQAAVQQMKPFPLSSTTKAILCNTAKDLGNPGPDYEFGYGRVDAFKAISSFQNNQYIEDSILHSQLKTYNINIPAGTAELRVLINWNDPATVLPATKILVNDIDIYLEKDGNTYLPYKLNPSNPSSIASLGRDSLNNTEQVVVKNPSAGIWQIKVKGYSIPQNNQPFSVSYYFENAGADITFPEGGEVIGNNTATFVRWTAFNTDSLVDVEFSRNGGNSWSLIGTTTASSGFIAWTTPSAGFTDSALIRIKNGSNIWSQSNSFFTIMGRPALNTLVCDYGLRLTWTAIDSAKSYVVLRYENNQWIPEDTVTASPYFNRNVKLGQEYIYALQPLRNNFLGPRSVAARVTIRSGKCNFTGVDLGIIGIQPMSGRKLTSKALSNNEKIRIKVISFRNITTTGNVKFSWQINNGTIKDSTIAVNILSGATFTFVTNDTYNFSDTGQYTLKAWINIAGDVESLNDTMLLVIRQLSNNPVQLPYFEGFENVDFSIIDSTIGIRNITKFDFNPILNGRASGRDNPFYSPGTGKSVNLDNYNDKDTSYSKLVLTLNLLNYKDSLLYMNFKYRSRGETTANDSVYVRGNDSLPWIGLYDLYANATPGSLSTIVSNLNISGALSAAGQSPGTSMQIMFSTLTTRSAASMTTNGGYNIDDLEIFAPGYDVRLNSVQYPKAICLNKGVNADSVSFTINVKNNYIDTIRNVHVYFRTDSDTVLVNSLKIAPMAQINYNFKRWIQFPTSGKKSFDVYLQLSGDFYPLNDTIKNNTIIRSERIQSLPYNADFESDTLSVFVPNGYLSSWDRGLPFGTKLKGAAEGNKSWATNLNSYYNLFEQSDLYLTCFQPSLFSASGQIAFHHALDTEDDYDKVALQYTQDLQNWSSLGKKNAGYNWYNQSAGEGAWEGERAIWQVASYPLSADSFPNNNTVFLRLHLSSDEMNQKEGFLLDDFRMLGAVNVATTVDSNNYISKSTGLGTVNFVNGSNKIIASVNDNAQNLDTIKLAVISGNECINALNAYKILPRRYFYESKNQPIQPVTTTLYITNDEYLRFINATDNVHSMNDIGVWLYTGTNTDQNIYNNAPTGYTFISPQNVKFLPVEQGYEVSFSHAFRKAEIYFKGADTSTNAPVYTMEFSQPIASLQEDVILPAFNVTLKCQSGNSFKDCAQGTITLTANACGLKGTLTKPVINGTAVFDDVFFNRSAQQNITFTAIYSGNCTGTVTSFSDTFNVLFPNLNADSLPLISNTAFQVCKDIPLALSPQISNANGGVEVLWSPSDGLSSDTILQPIFISDVSQNYMLIITDEDACADTSNIQVTVDESPEFLIQPLSSSACFSSFYANVSGQDSLRWQLFSGGNWQDIINSNTDFTGANTDSLLLLQASSYNQSLFRLKAIKGACTTISDSVQYFAAPLADITALGETILDEFCDYGNWRYYSEHSAPGTFLFAINWAPDGTISAENAAARNGAVVSIGVLNGVYVQSSVVEEQDYATFAMKRYWNVNINGDSLSENVQVKFFYDSTDIQEIQQAVAAFLATHSNAQYEGFSWFKTYGEAYSPANNIRAANVLNSIPLTDINFLQEKESGMEFALLDNISSFSGGSAVAGVGPFSNPLPVNLVQWQAKCQHKNVVLQWETASEKNAAYFELQRSDNGTQFYTIATINAGGNSFIPLLYSFIDSNSAAANYYYRLVQYDYDGTSEYFAIINADCSNQQEFISAYYLSGKGLFLHSELDKDTQLQYQLMDISGRLISGGNVQLSTGVSETLLRQMSIPKGVYLLHWSGSGKNSSVKFVVY